MAHVTPPALALATDKSLTVLCRSALSSTRASPRLPQPLRFFRSQHAARTIS
jgi:hypothetical protein